MSLRPFVSPDCLDPLRCQTPDNSTNVFALYRISDKAISRFHGSLWHQPNLRRSVQRYWIVKGGAAVRRSIGKCVFCKKQNAMLDKQLMAHLPIARPQINHPHFTALALTFVDRSESSKLVI